MQVCVNVIPEGSKGAVRISTPKHGRVLDGLSVTLTNIVIRHARDIQMRISKRAMEFAEAFGIISVLHWSMLQLVSLLVVRQLSRNPRIDLRNAFPAAPGAMIGCVQNST
jgi:hypothetical protein